MTAAPSYALGHADPEVERLQVQAKFLEKVTRRFIRECGVRPGMRVLDIGCGVGDVTFLIANAVGASGTVIGIDREPKAVETARIRAHDAGYRQVQFAVDTDESITRYSQFDAAIGRYVLVHQPDPTLLVRRAAAVVRPGGIIAFQEPYFHVAGSATIPTVDLWRRVEESLSALTLVAFPSHNVAGRLAACFEDAGLPTPQLTWESIVSGSPARHARYMSLTYQVFLPHIQKLGIAHSEIGDPATLYDRLVAAAKAARAQDVSLPQVCAWSLRPEI
jgi:2-polyprenyl-3-methyl-5-hydroxy-6-metoxy-1,4-benzoquinol methylase